MIGLMKLITHRLPKSHQVLVLGDELESNQLRMQGLSVLGSVQGVQNNSRTLGTRVRRVIDAVATKKDQLIAWGWHSTVAISGIQKVHKTIGYIDSIDANQVPFIEVDRIIPTTWTCVEVMKKNNSSKQVVMEPLVGIDAKSLVIDRTSVLNILGVHSKSLLVAVVNDVGKWQEIVSFVVQMKEMAVEVTVVVSDSYMFYSELYFALQEHHSTDCLRQIESGLRLIDVVYAATFVWAPTSIVHGALDGVLDLLSTSASGTPIAASHQHAITGIPTIGHRIAWVTSVSELSAWAMKLFRDPTHVSDQGLEIAARVRSVASPSKFVEGFQLRLQ